MENESESDRMRWQKGCTAGISPTNSFCGATNQSVLRESESTTCVCNETAESAHGAGAWSKWIAVQGNTPTGADLLLIHLSSLFSLFNKDLR